MIRALIVTPYRRYEFEVPAEHAPDCGQAQEWVHEQVYTYDGYIELPGRIIAIRHPDDVRSIEVWEEAPEPLPTAGLALVNMASLSISDEGPMDVTGEITYLGQPLMLRLITYRLRGYLYALPQEVNHMPALEALDHDKLGQIAEQLLHMEGISGTVILPPVQLEDDKQAGEYVMDYAEQATPPAYFSPHEKTARAYGGLWNEK